MFFYCLFPAGSLKQKQYLNLPFCGLAELLDKKVKYWVEVSTVAYQDVEKFTWKSSPFLISSTERSGEEVKGVLSPSNLDY